MAKYKWLKLEDNFFDDDEMVVLRNQKNGYEYIYLWQRLLLKCLKNADMCEDRCGLLRLNDKVPYTPDMLAEIFKMNIDTVKVGIDLFVKLGMVEILDDDTIYIEAVNKMIGKSGESTERVRRLREKRKILQIEQDKIRDTDTDIDIESNVSCNVTKEKHMDHVFLTPEEYEELINSYHKEDIDSKIASLNCYIANKDYRYSNKPSHYAIIIKWLVSDVMAGKVKTKPKPTLCPACLAIGIKTDITGRQYCPACDARKADEDWKKSHKDAV